MQYRKKGRRNDLRNMQILHGNIKKTIYDKPYERIMELGAGKLNDLLNWTEANIKRVYAIEIDEHSIKEGNLKYMKYSNMNLDYIRKGAKLPRCVYHQADINNDTDKIINKYKVLNENVDLIVCNFAIHYFMKDKKSINNFMKLVNYFLKPGGKFVFTCLDGLKVYNLFYKYNNDIEDVKGNFYDIRKLVYGDTNNPIYYNKKQKTLYISKNKKNIFKFKQGYDIDEKFDKYGQKVSIYVESIGKFHEEYLVNVEYLIKTLSDNYKLDLLKDFSEFMKELINKKKYVKKLSIQEFNYSKLNVLVKLIKLV